MNWRNTVDPATYRRIVREKTGRDDPRTTNLYQCGKLKVIVSHDDVIGWHLSISHPSRYPMWDEIREARYDLVPDEAYMAIIMPPKSEYVNVCETCFHLFEVPSDVGMLLRRGAGLV